MDKPSIELTPQAEQPPRLWSPSFIGLILTQAFGTMNDNVFRWLIIGLAKQHFTDHGQQSATIAWGMIALTLPYILLAAPAGFVADRFSKRRVITAAKFSDIMILIFGVTAIWFGNIYVVFTALFLMGAVSAMYSPSRAGSIPELVHPELISKANGWFGLTNLMSVIAGTIIGNQLAAHAAHAHQTEGNHLILSGSVLIGISVIGWLASFMINPQPAGNPHARLNLNFLSQTFSELRELFSHKALWRVALGIAFFWSLAALANLNIDQLVAESGGLSQNDNNVFLVCLTIGLGVGSVLAGYWSGNRIELGILPLGILGIVVSSFSLYLFNGSFFESTGQHTFAYNISCFFLFLLGSSAGMFNIPLESYLQENTPRETRGSILAASNFMTFSGIILMSGLYMLLRKEWLTSVNPAGVTVKQPLMSAKEVFLLCGVLSIPVMIYIIKLIPQAALRFLIWLITSCMYRVRIRGVENVPATGGVLLAANHISFLDAVLMVLTSPRPVRMFAWAGNFENKLMRKLADQWGVILVTNNPKSIRRALDEAHQALLNGEVVGIFPEGEISRTGGIQNLKPGMLKILNNTGAKVVPVYLDELWGSVFSFEDGKFFWKWPRKWRYPVSVNYGQPMDGVTDLQPVRDAIMHLGSQSVTQRLNEKGVSVSLAALKGCRNRFFRKKVADSTGVDLSGHQLLTRTLALRRALKRVLGTNEATVGILLPPTVPGVATNLAIAFDRRVMVNLNYTCTADILNECLRQAEIKSVITSQKFLDKLELNLDAKMIKLEEIKDQVTKLDKIVALLQTWLMPARVLGWWLGIDKTSGQDLFTLIFTSGSTGKPKGVMLTHANVMANAEAIDQVIHLKPEDTILGILPFFHALGSTVTLWTATSIDVKTAYHFSPLDARVVGKLCREHKGTVLLSTPTFLRSYIRRCEVEEFATLNTVVTGAERLPSDVAKAFEEKFHVQPVEGYGTTELSPLAAVNLPPSRAVEGYHPNRKEGTVGRPVPGVSAKTTNAETGETNPVGTEGLLWIGGANVMAGYLHREDLTSQVVKDGWYCTGDMGRVDDEGFIQITGRLSRFSKIGGEMVPHGAVEEELLKALNAGDAEKQPIAVSAVPDEKKGERLIVLYTELTVTPAELCQALSKAGLPNLFIPSQDSFYKVDELPVLGTGKLDLSGIKKLAEEVTNT